MVSLDKLSVHDEHSGRAELHPSADSSISVAGVSCQRLPHQTAVTSSSREWPLQLDRGHAALGAGRSEQRQRPSRPTQIRAVVKPVPSPFDGGSAELLASSNVNLADGGATLCYLKGLPDAGSS